MTEENAKLTSQPSSWPLRAQYVLALVTMAVALAVRWLLDPLVGDGRVPFVTVLAALLVLVLLVRTGPFLLAALAGAVGALVLFMPSGLSFSTGGVAGIWQLTLFAAAAVTGAWMSRRVQSAKENAEREVVRRTAEIRLVTDAVPALISYVDADLRYRFVNRGYAEWFGHPSEQIIGRKARDILGAEAHERVRPYMEEALAGRPCRYETELPHRDGSTRYIEAEYVPHVLDDGRVDGYFALISDVSDRKRAETAQARLAAIVEASGDAITSISLDGTFLTWNEGAERLFGYTPGEAVGRKVELLRPSQLGPEEVGILERVAAGQVVGPYDTVRRSKDGRTVAVSVIVSPIRDASGAVVGASKVDRDISARLAVERALRDSERALRAARARERAYLDHLPVGVWFANEGGDLTYANDAARRIWGGTRMVGPYEEFEAYWHGTDRRIGRREWALDRALVHGESSLGEVLDIVAFDGTRRTVLNSAVPVRDEGGAIVGGVVINLDISELKQAEAALKEADRRKDEFLAALAHELRNPLAAARSATELLEDASELGRERLEHAVATVRRQVGVMVRLVDDLLDVSRITRGALELRVGPVDLRALVEDTLASVRPMIDSRGHAVEVMLPEEPVELSGDGMRLAQVLTNVLSNAIDYTDRGGRIQVEVRREGGEAAVEVRDNGIGIPQEQLDSVFEMFTRLESSRRSRTGLGIGLSLSRQLVEKHGGTIAVLSDGPGHGTTVKLRLPLAAPKVDAPSAPDPVPALDFEGAQPRRILVVDDNVDAGDMLAILLGAQGHEVRTARDGRSALAEAAAFKPTAVLLDLGLPDIDGIEVCRALRAEAWGRDALVVAVSGWGQDEDKRRTAEAGFDAHLTKPARIEQVLRLVGGGQDRSGPEGTEGAA